jgi:hypothetical protein
MAIQTMISREEFSRGEAENHYKRVGKFQNQSLAF